MLIHGAADGQVGYGTKEGQVKGSMMRWSILAHDTCSVQTKDHIESADGHVVDDVVIGSLSEGRIYVAERKQSFRSQSAGEGYSVSFCDSYVESSLWHSLHHDVHAATCGHGRRYTHDLGILFSQLQQCMSEDILIFGWHAVCVDFDALSCFRVELSWGVKLDGILLCSLESFAFHRVDMKQFRALHVADASQGLNQFYHVVSVLRTEIADVHTLEDVLLVVQQGFQAVVESNDAVAAVLVEQAPFEQVLGSHETHMIVGTARVELMQIMLHASHTAVYAHVVVVEHYQQVIGRAADVVESFVCQSTAHASIANHSHHMPVLLAILPGSYGHSQCCRDAVGGMTASDGVVFAFFRGGERAKAVQMTVSVELLSPSCQYLVTTSLMPHIPYDAVVGRVEDVVESNSKLHHTKTAGKMAWVVG